MSTRAGAASAERGMVKSTSKGARPAIATTQRSPASAWQASASDYVFHAKYLLSRQDATNRHLQWLSGDMEIARTKERHVG